MYLQVVQITPPALRTIFIVFAALNSVDACIAWAFYPETAGLTLESVDSLFGKDDEPAGSKNIWNTARFAIVDRREGSGDCREG